MREENKLLSDKQISDIIVRLNEIANERKQKLDELWMLEDQTEKLRCKLLKKIKERDAKATKPDKK